MVGICLHPGKSYVEAKVRLYNRTPFAQTFLWWANVGIRVHEYYQAFFPPDVTYVADHAKRAFHLFRLLATFTTVSITEKAWTSPGTEHSCAHLVHGHGIRIRFFWRVRSQKNAGVVHFANHHVAPGRSSGHGATRIRIRLGPKPHDADGHTSN